MLPLPIDELRKRHALQRAELDALMPAVLDRAFRGSCESTFTRRYALQRCTPRGHPLLIALQWPGTANMLDLQEMMNGYG